MAYLASGDNVRAVATKSVLASLLFALVSMFLAFARYLGSLNLTRFFATYCTACAGPSVILRGQYYRRDKYLNMTNQRGGCAGVYLLRFDEAIFTGGGVQYQANVNDTGGALSLLVVYNHI
jgi:hypothetical protein